tara:strand:- start:359 stop:841 length:483 start_codon:yes stop_codon:yes gene_type:complete
MSDFEKQLFSEKLRRKMINIAMSKTKDIHDAEDLVQNTYLKAIEKKEQFKGDLVDPWVITILKNRFLDDLRKKREVTGGGITDDLPELSVPGYEEDILYERDAGMCLDKLSDDEREIIDLHQNSSYKEISKDLGINAGTLRQRKLRAQEKFIECMEFDNE